MTPEDHARLVENMRRIARAKTALQGLSDNPGGDLAALLRSDTPMNDALRGMLADFLDGRAERHGLPVAKFSRNGQKEQRKKLKARFDHVRRGLDCEANCAGDARAYARKVDVKWTTMERSLEFAQAFHRWFDNDMPHEFRDPGKLRIHPEEWDAFLHEAFAEWLLANPGDDPLVFPRDKKPQSALRG